MKEQKYVEIFPLTLTTIHLVHGIASMTLVRNLPRFRISTKNRYITLKTINNSER